MAKLSTSWHLHAWPTWHCNSVDRERIHIWNWLYDVLSEFAALL